VGETQVQRCTNPGRLVASETKICTVGLTLSAKLLILGRVREIAKSDYQLRHGCLSVRPSIRPHGTTRLQVDGISGNLIFRYFWNSCRENSSFIKT
jgi:hypothetical protein